MPEIPLLTDRTGTVNATQAIDTRDSRMMGGAVADLGRAIANLPVFREVQTKEMDWRVNAAKEALRYDVERARRDKRFNDPVNDPSGVKAMEQLNNYSKERQAELVEQYGITGAYRLKFQGEAQSVTTGITTEYATDSMKDAVGRVNALQEEALAAKSYNVRTNPRLLSTTLSEYDLEINSDPTLREDEKVVKSIQGKRTLLFAAIDGRKNANGPLGMSEEDYNQARQMLALHGSILTQKERDTKDKELFDTFHEGVKLRTAMDNLATQTKDKAQKERAERAMVLLDDERERAGNDPVKIAQWTEKVQAMRASQHITREQAQGMLRSDPAQLQLQDQVAGGTIRQMLFDVNVSKSQAQRVGIDTRKKDNLQIATEFINNRFANGKISAKKREELINEVQSIREFERRAGRSFIEELNKAKFQAEVTAVENTVLDPKARAEIKARLYEEAIRQARATNSTVIDVGAIRDTFVIGYGPQFGQTTEANKTEGQLSDEIRRASEELRKTTDPTRKKFLIQEIRNKGNQIENIRKFSGGNSGSSGNTGSNRSRRSRATTED